MCRHSQPSVGVAQARLLCIAVSTLMHTHMRGSLVKGRLRGRVGALVSLAVCVHVGQ